MITSQHHAWTGAIDARPGMHNHLGWRQDIGARLEHGLKLSHVLQRRILRQS